jgi:hypothetical protein
MKVLLTKDESVKWQRLRIEGKTPAEVFAVFCETEVIKIKEVVE